MFIYLAIIIGFLLQNFHAVIGWLVVVGGVVALVTDYFDVEKEAKKLREKKKHRLTY